MSSTLVPSTADIRMVKCRTCGAKLRTPDEQIPVAVWGIANQQVFVVKCRQCATNAVASVSPEPSA